MLKEKRKNESEKNFNTKLFHTKPYQKRDTYGNLSEKHLNNKTRALKILVVSIHMGLNADPGFDTTLDLTATKVRAKNVCCPTFYCSHKYHKNVNNIIFNRKRKKFEQIYNTKNYSIFYQKTCH
jgi:hypothetical protein